MIKRLYLANGHLAQPLDSSQDDIAVDSSIASQLNTLSKGDSCFLSIIEDDKIEVVKITNQGTWYKVDRAQASTERQSFSTNANIVYRLTDQEIIDSVNGSPLALYYDGYSPIQITNNNGVFTVTYSQLNVQGIGGISCEIRNWSEIIISDNIGAFGCCDTSLTGAPFPGGIPFYLTSQVYAVYDVDSYVGINRGTPSGKTVGGMPPKSYVDIPPVNVNSDGSGGFWLLVQPNIIEPYVNNTISLGQWELFGSSTAFTVIESAHYINNSISIVDGWQLYGGAAAFTVNETKNYVSMDSYVLDMQLFGGSIIYNNGLDKYVSPTISLLNWTLN